MDGAMYLRKSREEETETREETLARHQRILEEYCKRNNLTIKKTYKEVVSGESIEKRPQMKQLLQDVSNGLYDYVVVVELERLSRGNQIDQAEILEVFKKSKTKIHTLNKVYDLSNENELDEEFFEFGLFMSRREYKVIRRRLMRGREQALKEGYSISSQIPVGFNRIRGDKGFVLVPNEEEMKMVNTIFNKFVYEDYTLAQLKDYLNELGFKPKHSDYWTSKKVKIILRNKTYIGYLPSTYVKSYPSIWYKGKHDPVIDEETFNLAQEKLNIAMTHTATDKTLVNPLASFTKCSFCGVTLRSVQNKKRLVVRCSQKGCKNTMADIIDVEKVLINELQAELDNFNYYIENFDEEIEKKKEAVQTEINLINNEINKKEKMIDKCCEMLEEGIYTKEKYLTRVNILEQDLKALKTNLEDILAISFDETDRMKNAIPILTKVLDEYWNLTPIEKNNLLKSIIDKVEYTKTEQYARKGPHDLSLINLKVYLKI